MSVLASIARPSIADLARRLPPECARVLLRAEDASAAAHGALLATQDREHDAAEVLTAARREHARQRDAWASHGRKLDPTDDAALTLTVTNADADLARRRAAREDAGARYRTARQRLDRLLEFVTGVGPDRLRAAPEPKLPRGATLESVRSELIQTAAQIEATQVAPLPRAEVVAALKAEVTAIAERGAPQVDARLRDGAPARLGNRLAIASTGTGSLIGDAGTSFLVWVMADEIVAKLSALVSADLPGALSDAARTGRLRELRDRLRELERIEEQLVRAAEAEGRMVERRPDASAAAQLSVQIEGGA